MTGTTVKKSILIPELDAQLERGEPLILLDVRNDEEFARWQIESRHPVETIHIPYFNILEDESLLQQVPSDKEVIVVCRSGNTATHITNMLHERGNDNAALLEGGINAWGHLYREHAIPTVEPDMTLYQIIRPARGDLAYIVRSGNEAILIDPTRHVEHYLDIAERDGIQIVAVFDTHAHADHISGGPEIAKRLGISYFLHPYDGIHPIDMLPATIEFERLWDGFTYQFGNATLKGIHIPGHTLGNMAFLVNDRYLFTGDSLFIRSIARPDLGGRGETWAPLHYDSLYNKLLTLPEETLVLPAHFAKMGESREDGTFYDTLGSVKRNNPELQFPDKEVFVQFLLDNLPTFPAQYVDIKRVNAGLLHPTEEEANALELGKNLCALSGAYA